ncbi:unnamed protein product, partial [Oppiella nova]
MFSLNVFNKWFVNKCPNNWRHILRANVSQSCGHLDANDLQFNRFQCLATNKRIESKIKIILNELKVYRNSDQYKHLMPSKLSVHQMRQLLDCSESERRRRIWIDLSPQRRRHLLSLMTRLETNDGLNQLTEPFMPYQFEKFYTNGLKNACLFGQNLVFDISFDSHMSTLECKNLAEQLHRIYDHNRYESRGMAFHLNLCNVNESHKSIQFLRFLFPKMVSNESYLNITSQSYLDLFPKDDLIYLSPHAQQVMTEYESNAVFIIGGIVDRNQVLDLSYPKAMQQNIRSMRLPIDSLVSKSNIQSLDSVFKVLVDFKNCGLLGDNCMDNRLETTVRKHLPKHKLKSVNQIAFENMKKQEIDH